MGKTVCFDVLGTCFGFETAIAAIEQRLGAKLKKVNVDSKSLFFSWFYAAQRDYTYCSMLDNYVPIAQVLSKTFKRACLIVDLPADEISDDDTAAVMQGIKGLEARPGLKECYQGLSQNGWEVYGVTNGARESSLNYYKQAGVEIDAQHVLSCDDFKRAKPDKEVYDNTRRVLAKAGAVEDEERWFVAAHSWDLLAARQAGFKTAYLDIEEHDSVTEIFGTFDLHASSFEDLQKRLNAL